jgi:hypothetical protein
LSIVFLSVFRAPLPYGLKVGEMIFEDYETNRKENKIVLGVTTRVGLIRSIFCFAIAAQRMPHPNANP